MPRQLSHSVEHIAKQAVGKDWGLYAALLDHWQEIVGAEYAAISTPIKIVFPHQPNEARRRNGTLTIRLPKGLAMEFSFKSEQMRQRINSYFGYDAIGRLLLDPVFSAPIIKKSTIKADPAKVADISEKVSSLDSDELRDALRTFGEAVLKSEPNRTSSL